MKIDRVTTEKAMDEILASESVYRGWRNLRHGYRMRFAWVTSPYRRLIRHGKGYSPEEIRRAGLTIPTLRRFGLPVDLRRSRLMSDSQRTRKLHYMNVRSLKEIGEIIQAVEDERAAKGITPEEIRQ